MRQIIKPVMAEGSQLTAIRLIGYTWRNDNHVGDQVWDCRCSCGNLFAGVRRRLEAGQTKSCGCLRRAMGIEKLKAAREAQRKKRVERLT
jgi:hypothetical protein